MYKTNMGEIATDKNDYVILMTARNKKKIEGIPRVGSNLEGGDRVEKLRLRSIFEGFPEEEIFKL